MDQTQTALEEPDGKRNNTSIPHTTYVRPGSAAPYYPGLFQTTLNKEQQMLFTNNGHGKLVKSLTIEVVSDMDRAWQLWDTFSPKKSLFDTWDFRMAFWQGYKYDPYFLVLRTGDKPVAVLPLWYEPDRGGYYWFGSWWQEDNTFFVKDPILTSLLLAAAPQPLHLNAIKLEAVVDTPLLVTECTADDPKYILDLNTHPGTDAFLTSLTHKKRYNFKRDQRIITEQDPQIFYDRFEDFEHLVTLSKERFSQKGEDTDWNDLRRVEAFREVIARGQKKTSFSVRMISVEIDGYLAAVDLIAIYNGVYYPLKCGYDVHRFPGIGNYMNLLEIDDAVDLDAHTIDFLEIGYGWKDKWFTALPLLKFEK
mgnify:CR=1 FL=1